MSKENKETKKREKHDNIWEALSAFQGDIPPIEKSKKVDWKSKKTGRRVKYSYAPLGQLRQKIDPILSKHGLSLVYRITECPDEKNREYKKNDTTIKERLSEVEAILRHETHKPVENPQQIKSGAIFVDQNQGLKDVAGDITKAKRYATAIVTGIGTEEDIEEQGEASGTKAKAGKKLDTEAVIQIVESTEKTEKLEALKDKIKKGNRSEDDKKEIIRAIEQKLEKDEDKNKNESKDKKEDKKEEKEDKENDDDIPVINPEEEDETE